MISTQPVWISPQAYERLQKGAGRLFVSCVPPQPLAVIPTKTVPLSNEDGRHGFNRFMICWPMQSLAWTHPTTGSPNPAWF